MIKKLSQLLNKMPKANKGSNKRVSEERDVRSTRSKSGSGETKVAKTSQQQKRKSQTCGSNETHSKRQSNRLNVDDITSDDNNSAVPERLSDQRNVIVQKNALNDPEVDENALNEQDIVTDGIVTTAEDDELLSEYESEEEEDNN